MAFLRAHSAWIALAAAALATGCESGRDAWMARAERNLAQGEYRAALIDIRNLIREEPANAELRLKHAEVVLRLGDADSAAVELAKARELGAPAERVAKLLVEAHLARGSHAAALEELAALEAANPTDPELPRMRGMALLGLQRYAEARTQLVQALESDPSSVSARLAYARTLAELDGMEAARRELDAAAQLAPQDPAVWLALGGWHLDTSDYPAASEAFSKAAGFAEAAKHRLYGTLALAALGDAQLSMAQLEAAEQTHRVLRERAPGSAPELMLGARVAARQGRFEDAQVALQRILSQSPRSYPAGLMMGAVTFARGKLSSSEMYLSAALSGHPENLAARRLLAEVQLRQSKAREVLASLEASGAAGDPQLLETAGRASVLIGDLNAAIAYFERSSRAAPTDVERSLDLAAAYLSANRARDAVGLIEKLPESEELLHRRELLRLTALARAGNMAEARRRARELAGSRANDPLALLVAARGLVTAEDAAGARELLERMVQIDPGSATSWIALGAFEFEQGRFVEAERAFDRALARDPRDLDALIARARVALARGDRQEAFRRLENARRLHVDAISPRVALARLHLQQTDVGRANELLKELQERAPNDPQVRLLAAHAALAAQKPAEAITILERLVEDVPARPALRMELAQAYVLTGRTADARRAALDALRVDSEYWPALALLTSTALQEGDLEAAALALSRVRQSAAPSALVATLDGDQAFRRGDYGAAVRLYEEARRTVPLASLALKEYEARRAAGDSDRVKPLREWLQRSPQDDTVRFALAQDLHASGDHAAAEAEYAGILEARPQHAAALNNMAWLQLDAGNVQEALELAERAYTQERGNPAIADTYGWVLTRVGRPQAALPVLRSAYEASASAEIRYHLASALAAAGERTEARGHLEAILGKPESAPLHERARELLKELRGG